jgi:large subunit ribosomal protein L17
MLRNQATALLRHEHLTTTVPRAKELRPFVERLITIAKRGLADGAANGRTLHARRLVMHDLQDRAVVTKLFDTIAPRFAERAGGYTRLLRVGFRRGDAADVAQVELVGSEYNPRAKAEAEAKKAEAAGTAKKPGVGGRLRAAANRLRGKKEKDAADEAGGDTEGSPRPAGRGKPASRTAAKRSQSRKTGGEK